MPQTPNTGREACDAELHDFFDKMSVPFELVTDDQIKAARKGISDTAASVQHKYEVYGKLDHKLIKLKDTNKEPFELSVFTPKDKPAPAGGRPCLYFIHGGGFVTNNQYSGIDSIFPCIADLNAVCVSINYNLAPESIAPNQMEQCYQGLVEFWNRYKDAGKINFDRLAVIGRSAGAALLVGLNLKIRERTKINIKCNIMSFPMLDDVCATESHKLFKKSPFLPSKTVKACWKYCLKIPRKSTKYTVPAKATTEDLKNFPETLVEIAEADVLRDEGSEFAAKLKSAGVRVACNKFAGFHCFDGGAGGTKIGQNVKQMRLEFLKKQMA
ncbi:hypothetical protein UA08_08107 [Talaromyces atroroseus]|uniref:Alpha/beta hydrolase fold-3 domain-containing protein n=1 Tax=Talaromyces atroroseus TaxID=1441469 RepID=A0A225AHN7_TALAT|nr:hypothetical protein UA08_08107 [Talaromyces atroroseus]OKL56588.1 hypothetical protein UA08_08107 [Talaromyces atroroseus]